VEPLEDSVLSAIESLYRITFVLNGLASLTGRKSMLLFSEYVALSSDSAIFEYALPVERAYGRLMDAAMRTSTTIYGIDPRGLRMLGPYSLAAYRESQWGKRYLAKATGGQFFSDNNQVSLLTKAAMDDQQGYYLLGYTPDASTFDPVTGRPKSHKTAVQVKRPGLRVRTHSGFLGEEDQLKLPAGSTNAVVASLTSPFGSSDMEVGMSSLFFNSAGLGSHVTTLLNVKAAGMTFGEEGDARTAEGDIALMVFGDNGAVLEQPAASFSKKLSGAEFDLLARNGLPFSIDLPVKKAGPCDLRLVVRDKATARIGTASQFVVVPELKAGRMTLSSIMLQADLGASEGGLALAADVRSSAALRVFRPGDTLTYGYRVLNPKPEKRTGQPKVEVKVSLYRDGKEFLSGKPVPVEVVSDPTRLLAGGDVKVGADMPPGEYVLQVNVTDLLGDKKYRTATQYIDFRVQP
jgi:hypothetical protein